MPDSWTTWRASDEDVWPAEESRPDDTWALHTADPLLLNAVLRRGLVGGLKLLLAPAFWSQEKARQAAVAAGARALLSGSRAGPVWNEIASRGEPPTGGSYLGVFTSGSSAEPKLALHDWSRISRAGLLAAERLPGARWLMAYSPFSFAGLQVFFAAEAAQGQIVYPAGPLAAGGEVFACGAIDAVSATPTWWRMAIAALPAGAGLRPLRQATLGGERVDQAVIDAVARVFQPERLTHVYASTEAGSAIAVSDRREGFPAAWLEDSGRPIQLRVREGVLEVCSPFRMKCYAGAAEADAGWYRTPDLVEVVADRVLFRGRSDTVVNVGGAKVVLEEVERAVLALPGILDCRVYVRASPVTGALLAAEFVPERYHKPEVSQLKHSLRANLPPFAIPQVWKPVARLALTPNGKKSRS
jgi:acyl-coenzyme A synthetase/AMP-(fatty) acid ligase